MASPVEISQLPQQDRIKSIEEERETLTEELTDARQKAYEAILKKTKKEIQIAEEQNNQSLLARQRTRLEFLRSLPHYTCTLSNMTYEIKEDTPTKDSQGIEITRNRSDFRVSRNGYSRNPLTDDDWQFAGEFYGAFLEVDRDAREILYHRKGLDDDGNRQLVEEGLRREKVLNLIIPIKLKAPRPVPARA